MRVHPDEEDRLIGSLLIKVTDFFRDPAAFDHLRERVLPELIAHAREDGEELRFWSAGCATGEEAYSLAILVSEALRAEAGSHVPVRIFATDLDGPAIGFARRGGYSTEALGNVPAELRERYFTLTDGAYVVTQELRDLIVFGEHDLGGRPPFPRVDLVLCRNVLMYFSAELQQRALQAFAFSLRPGGYLVLGSAENARALEASFTPESSALRIYRRTAEPGAAVVSFGTATSRPPAPTPLRLAPRPTAALPRETPLATGAEGLVQELPVGLVVVNRAYDIQQINTAARRLLGIHGVAVNQDLIHLVDSLATAELRRTIDAAFEKKAPAALEEVATAELGMGEQRYLQITCLPRIDSSRNSESVIITVIDVTTTVRRRIDMEASERAAVEELERLKVLMGRLGDTNSRLLAANAELASAEESLRTTSEEYAAAAAQAQTASEELETYGEELQASNEELETLNEELRATVDELTMSNADLDARQRELGQERAQADNVRRQLAAILDGLTDAVVVVGRTGPLIRSNAAFDALLDGTSGELEVLDLKVPWCPRTMPHSPALEGVRPSTSRSRSAQQMARPDGSKRLGGH